MMGAWKLMQFASASIRRRRARGILTENCSVAGLVMGARRVSIRAFISIHKRDEPLCNGTPFAIHEFRECDRMNASNLCKFGLREARLCQHLSDILLHIHLGIIC